MRDSERLSTLINIISTQRIHNQQELHDAMFKEGYDMTQSTISRDLKTLRIKKTNKIYGLPTDKPYIRIHKQHIHKGESLHWYAMTTRKYREKQVADLLATKGIETWLPERHTEGVGSPYQTIIPKIIFIHCSQHQCRSETFVDGTMGYIIHPENHQPVVIPDEEIIMFQKLLTLCDVVIDFDEEVFEHDESTSIHPLTGVGYLMVRKK